MAKSNPLRFVIATIIATGSVASFNANADYCTANGCYVTHAWFVPIIAGGGGSGGGPGGGTENTDQTDPWSQRDYACNEMWATMPADCDYVNPPLLCRTAAVRQISMCRTRYLWWIPMLRLSAPSANFMVTFSQRRATNTMSATAHQGSRRRSAMSR